VTSGFEMLLFCLGVKRSAVRIRPARQKARSEALFRIRRTLDGSKEVTSSSFGLQMPRSQMVP
jgi:hypothetical protein